MIDLGARVEMWVARDDPARRAIREPLLDHRFALWDWDGTRPSARLPPCDDDDVLAAITTLAGSEYRAFTWMAAARGLGEALGVDRVPAIVRAMQHPPRPEEHVPVVIWVRLAQIAAAMILANVDPDVPWADSARRRALLSLARNPPDWITDATIVALVQIALRDESARAEIVSELDALGARELSLAACSSILPGLGDAAHAAWIARVRRIQEG
jgi:hypothetical protein